MQIFARNRARQHFAELVDNESDDSSEDEGGLGGKFGYVNTNVSLNRNASIDLSSMSSMSKEFALALENAKKAVVSMPEKESKMQENLSDGEDSQNEEDGREAHRDSIVLLDKHRATISREFVRSAKRARQEKDLAEKAERAEKAAAEKSLSAQSSSSSLAPTYSYSSLHSSQTTQRASNVGIRGRKFPHVVETNYEELMEKATKAHLESIAAAETQLPKLCPENHTLPYFNSRKAAVKLLQFRHKDVLSSGPHSEEAPDSAPPTYMQHIVEESERYFDPSLAVPETFFRDFTLEQKVRRLAYSTEIDQFFGQLNVQEALAEVSTDGEEGNDGRDGSLSGRSLQYFLEHEEENKRAFELLLQGMNSRIVNGVREYERFQRIKQYVHKRRNLQQLTLRQVQDLHIINHFQKPHEYSDSEEEEVKETEEDTLNLSNLLGDYADQSNLQTLIDERAKEEEKANKPKLNVRPKTSQVNPDLYRRLSARVSMHRNSVSEGGERHNISSIRKGRSTMYISLNNVLLDGKVIKEIAQTKDDDGHKNTDLNWEAMTDSLSTVLSTSNLTAESTVQVLPIVLEEDSPGGGSPAGRRTPGGRFWTPSRDSVIERHIEAEFMCVRAPQSQFREAEQAKAFEDELETKHDSAERSEIEHRENNVVVYAGDDQQPFFDETEIVGTKHVISAEDSADVRRHLYFNDDTIDAKGLCVVQPSTSVRSRERRHANIDIRTSRPASTTKTASKPSSPGQLVETKSETVEFVQRISSVNREHSVLPQPIDVCDDPHVVPTTHCDSHSPEHTINKTNPESFSTSRESTPLAHKQVCFVPAPQGDQSLYAGTLTNSLRATTPLIQVQVRVPSPLAERQTDAAHEILQKEWPQEEDMPCDDELLSLLQEVSVSREAEKDPLLSKSDSVNKLYKKKVVHNIDLPFRSNKQRNKYVYTNNRQYKTKPTPPTTPTPASSTPSRPVRFGVKGLRCDFSVPKCGDNQDEDNSDMHSSKSHSTSDLPTIHTRHHVHTSPPHHAHHANPQPSSILSKIFHQYRIDPSTNILLTSSLPTPHSYPASDFSGIQHVIDRSVEIEGGLEIEIGEGLTGSSLGGESTMSACVPNLVFTPRDLSLRSEELNLWMQGMDSLEGVGYSNFGGVDEIVIDSGGSKEAVIAERIELDVTSTMPRPSIDTEDNQGSNDAAIKQPGESIVEGNLDSAAHGDDSINPLPSLTLNSSVVSANSGQEETEFTPNHPTSTLTLPATQTLQSNPPSSFRKSSRLLQSPNRKNRVLKGWASGVVEGGSEMGSPLPPQSLLISDDPRTLLVEGVEGRVYYSSDGSESIFNPFREGKSGRGEVKMNKTTVQLSPHVTAPPALSPPVSNEIFRNSTKRKKSAMQSTARKEDIQYDDEVEDDKDNSKRKFGLLLGVGGGTFTLPTVL
ncbi:hypothetical protein EON65_04395 [archaeon]|nr:MAG: hypothetical protein EON65_04395 [archaeon]